MKTNDVIQYVANLLHETSRKSKADTYHIDNDKFVVVFHPSERRVKSIMDGISQDIIDSHLFFYDDDDAKDGCIYVKSGDDDILFSQPLYTATVTQKQITSDVLSFHALFGVDMETESESPNAIQKKQNWR